MNSIDKTIEPSRILQRSICAGMAIAITALALHGVVGFAATSYEAASSGLVARETRSLSPVIARTSAVGVARGLVSRAGRRAASSIRVVLAR